MIVQSSRQATGLAIEIELQTGIGDVGRREDLAAELVIEVNPSIVRNAAL